MIFFVPNYMQLNMNFFSNYIACIKISPNLVNKLTHKDYMGSIYSLGIKNDVIGDIFATSKAGYVFCQKSISEYIILNLYKVGNQDVSVEEISLDCNEIKELEIGFKEVEVMVPSKRIDVILAYLYKLSRNEVKDKIQRGDLIFNDKIMYYISTNIKEGDIISFKRCGKFRVGCIIRKTRSEKIVLKIYKYV